MEGSAGGCVGAKVAIGVTVGTQVMTGSGSSVGRGVTVGTIVIVGISVAVGAIVAVRAMVGITVTVTSKLELSGAVVGDAQADNARKRVNIAVKILFFLMFIVRSFLKIYKLILSKILE